MENKVILGFIIFGMLIFGVFLFFSNQYYILKSTPADISNIPVQIKIKSIYTMGYSQEQIDGFLKDINDQKKQGFGEATEEDVSKVDFHKDVVLPIDQALPQLTFAFTNLQRFSSLWGQTQLVGIQPSGSFLENEGWTGATTLYRHPTLGDILVVETYLQSNDYIEYPQESINLSIKGNPSVLSVDKSKSGKALTSLTWTTQDKDYALYMRGNANSDKALHKQLMDLARDIPMSHGSFEQNQP